MQNRQQAMHCWGLITARTSVTVLEYHQLLRLAPLRGWRAWAGTSALDFNLRTGSKAESNGDQPLRTVFFSGSLAALGEDKAGAAVLGWPGGREFEMQPGRFAERRTQPSRISALVSLVRPF